MHTARDLFPRLAAFALDSLRQRTVDVLRRSARTDVHAVPEAGIWRCVDAPAMLGGEELGVCDFVKIFQAEVEGVMMSWSQGNAPLPSSERGKDGE